MAANASLNRLLNVLAERDIGLGYDDLAWLFESPQSRDAMTSWVHEYLSPATLLTPEELELQSTISLPVSNVKNSTEQDAPPRPLEEADFETAINSLETSTAAIEKQCAILEAQRGALRELQMLNRKSAVPLPEDDQKSQSRARAKTQLDLETSELASSIKQRLGTAQRQVETTITSLNSSSQTQLNKDDRMLDGLQKVMSKLGPLESNKNDIPDFGTLARALVKLESKIIKDQTNAIYSAALRRNNVQSNGAQQDNGPAIDQEISALTEELDSLINEVDSVLEMTINHQYQAPIADALRHSNAQSRRQQQQWLEYVKVTLCDMAERLQNLATYTRENMAYASAVKRVSDAFTETLPPPTQPSSRLERKQSVRTHSSKKPLKPFLHRTDSQVSKDPALEMLGYHGIRLPAEAVGDNEAVLAALLAAVQERRSRLQNLQKSTEQSIVGQVAESINVADGQLQNLLKAVFAYTPYGTPNLADKDAKGRLAQLEQDIAGLADGMRHLDVDRLAEVEKQRLLSALGERANG